jgi:hypothetical protein
MKKIEVGLGCEGLIAWVKDKLKAWDMMDYRDNEVWVVGLVSMERGKEQGRLQSMDREFHVKVWSGSYLSWRSSKVKICVDIKWLDGMNMRSFIAMDNGKGSVVGYTCWWSLFIIGSEDGDWMLACHHQHGEEMKCAKQRYFCRAFHFTGLWVVKYLIGFRVDICTIKRGILFC